MNVYKLSDKTSTVQGSNSQRVSLGDIKNLKDSYRIGKKQKSGRSQVYIKLTQSNDVFSRKHLLKYFCLKFQI